MRVRARLALQEGVVAARRRLLAVKWSDEHHWQELVGDPRKYVVILRRTVTAAERAGLRR